MEVKQMKADVEYATCDGHLVVPIAPVHSNWGRTDKNEVVELNGVISGDPWADCSPRHLRSPGAPYARSKGVKVKSYKVDRDGKRTGEGSVSVVPARDIKGLWADYLVLYAHVITAKFDERAQWEREQALCEATSKRLAAVGLKASVMKHTNYPKSGKTTTYRLELQAGDEKALERLTTRLEALSHA